MTGADARSPLRTAATQNLRGASHPLFASMNLVDAMLLDVSGVVRLISGIG
jgi:hypothetical protein